MKPSFLVDLLDLYGKDIPLQIFGAHKKKSLFGALIGLTSIGFIAAVTIYFLTTLFSRDTKQIITNQDTKTISKNDLTNVPMIFTLTDSLGNFILPDPSIWSVTAWNYRANYQNTQPLGINLTFLDVHPCTAQDKGTFSVSDSLIPLGLCIPLGKQENILNSIANDVVNGWSSITFLLTKCDGNVNPSCKNRTYVDSVFEGAYLTLGIFVHVIDNDNATNPNYWQTLGTSIQVSNSLFKQTIIKLTQNLYTDDNGFVFESLVTYDFFTIGDIKTDYSLKPPLGLPGIGTNIPVAQIWLNNSPFIIRTKRTFLKAQAVLANIGGVIKFIMVCAQVITQFVLGKNVFIQIANEVFQFSSNENKNVAESAIKINVAQKKDYKFIEIEGRTEKVVRINDDRLRNIGTEIISPNNLKLSKPFNIPRVNSTDHQQLKLNLWELICVTFCIRNKRVMKQYELSEKTILEKVSIHSIIQDSFKLDNLSKHILDNENYRNWRDNKLMPLNVDV